MANRRRSTRRRRRAPIRRPVRRPPAAAETAPQRAASSDRPAASAGPGRGVVLLPSLPYLRRDLVLSAALGVGLTLVLVVLGAVIG